MGDDLVFVPEQQQEEAAPTQAPAPPKDDGIGFVPDSKTASAGAQDLGFVPDDSQTSTIGAAAEGLAKGIAGPLATAGEVGLSKLGVPNLSAEDQKRRAEEHPYAEGAAEAAGLVGGAFIPGLGELSLGSKIGQYGKAAEAAAKALEIGKVGQTALKLGIEGGMFKLADNASKMILGQTDPEAPVASLLAGMPAATLLGGGLGIVGGKAAAKLQDLTRGKSANAASQWLADLGSRFDLISKHGGLEGSAEAGADQAQHLFDTVGAAVEDGFALKRNSVEKLTAGIPAEKTNDYIANMMKTLQGASPEMKESKLYQNALNDWSQSVMPGKGNLPSAADVFEATDDLKRKLQYWSKFEKRVSDPNQLPFVQGSRKISDMLRTSLEDSEHWGEMGDFQKQLNTAYSGLQGPLKDFTKAATQSVNGEPQVDKGKIFNLFRQLGQGKLSADIRADKISNFFDPATKFLKTVGDLHAAQGLESNIPPVSTEILDEMLKKNIGGGSKTASWLFDSGQSAAGMAGSHAVGTAVGAMGGHPYLGYRAGEALYPLMKELGKKPTRWAVAGMLRALAAGEYSSIPEAMNYAEGINNGARRIEESVNNVFRTGGKSYINVADEAKREALKKFIAEGQLNQQIGNQKNQGNQKENPISPQPSFAHGGEVLAPEPAPVVKKPVPTATDGMGPISKVFPEQSMLLGMAKGRVNNYLNSVRPQKLQSRLPFDKEMTNRAHEKSYNRALDIANQPLSVIDHIKGGTLEPEHVQHLNGLYPELANHLRKKLTEKITEAQMKDEKPSHKVRQGLSLFMGSALEANLTPQNIQAAQATFIQQNAHQQAGVAMGKKKADKLSDAASQYRTSQQASVARQNRSKA